MLQRPLADALALASIQRRPHDLHPHATAVGRHGPYELLVHVARTTPPDGYTQGYRRPVVVEVALASWRDGADGYTRHAHPCVPLLAHRPPDMLEGSAGARAVVPEVGAGLVLGEEVPAEELVEDVDVDHAPEGEERVPSVDVVAQVGLGVLGDGGIVVQGGNHKVHGLTQRIRRVVVP
eukprot:766895-Hanusia_phi.AAC.1